MKRKHTILIALVLAVLAAFFGVPGEDTSLPPSPGAVEVGVPGAAEVMEAQVMDDGSTLITADGIYTTKDDVALYIHTYGCLPQNFMTKEEARDLGWEGGGLEDIAPGMCIGGDRFGNFEGLLPEDREYTECDIDTLGADKRGAKRIVFSDDGLIYYTEDHYESFELLYGEP
nr:ribonuclease [Oscillospiraceae bacterium]